MKKIRLFSTKATKGIEGEEAELYVNFYLVLNKNYIFTFLIESPNLACSDRNPIKLWTYFLIQFEEKYVKYMRRYERMMYRNDKGRSKDIKQLPSVTPQPKTGHWNAYEVFQGGIKEKWLECPECKWSNALVIPRKYCPNCGAKMTESEVEE